MKIGDRVKLIGLTRENDTGIIVAKSDRPNNRHMRWWKVKLEASGNILGYPEDWLVSINSSKGV